MTALQIRLAAGSDRKLLDGFVCTTPQPRGIGRRRPPHPRPWELATQSWLRGESLRGLNNPPSDRRTALLFDGDELVAVACHDLRPDLEGPVGSSPVRMVMAVAVSLDRRRRDRSVADAAFAWVAADAEARHGRPTVLVAGVHALNVPSQAALERAGYQRQQAIEAELGVKTDQVWVRPLPMPASAATRR